MNVIVAIGFWLDWKYWRKDKVDHVHNLTKQINANQRSISRTASTVNKVVDEISQMKIFK